MTAAELKLFLKTPSTTETEDKITQKTAEFSKNSAVIFYKSTNSVPKTNFQKKLSHIGKTLYCLSKILYSLVGVAVFNSISYTMADMSLKDKLTAFVECRFCGVDLRQNILTGNVLIYHSVNRLHLTDNSAKSFVQSLVIHTVFHKKSLLTYITGYMYMIPVSPKKVNRTAVNPLPCFL